MSLGVQRNGPRLDRITEAELLIAHREVARPCACGGIVLADPHDPRPGVAEHRETVRHQAWLETWER